MSMCHWRHVTCDIHLEGDIRKYIIAIIQSECMISTGGITITDIVYMVYVNGVFSCILFLADCLLIEKLVHIIFSEL